MGCVQGFWQNNIGVLLFFLPYLNWVFAIYTQNNISQLRSNRNHMDKSNDTSMDTSIVTLFNIHNKIPQNFSSESSKRRVKRNSGSSGGKYTDAAKMPQVKVMRLYLQMFKNLWASTYIGGAHPFHHEVPKPVVYLFKDKIATFFFPEPQKTETEEDKKSK